jgi:hypothetical protein
LCSVRPLKEKMNINLRFINASLGGRNTPVVICMKNAGTGFGSWICAWKVIRNCGQDCYHPFTYSSDLEIGISDDFGNYSPRLPAPHGSSFEIRPTVSGRQLYPSPPRDGAGINSTRVQVKNCHPQGSFHVNVWNSGRLLAQRRNIAPLQSAGFEFYPELWIAACSEMIEEGQMMDPAIIPDMKTPLSLSQIRSADIVMTGGGTGTTVQPYTFNLVNIVMGSG